MSETIGRRNQFLELLCRLLDCGKDDAALEEMAVFLRSSPEFADDLVAFTQCEAALEEYHSQQTHIRFLNGVADIQPANLGPSKAATPVRGAGAATPVARQRTSSELVTKPRLAAWSALAAGLLVALATYLYWPRSYATVVEARGVVWKVGSYASVGTKLGRGWYELEAGTLQINCASSAGMSVEGPASFRVDGPNRAEVEIGTITAHVPDQARGFAIRSEDLRVVDIGTSFRLKAAFGAGSEVHVLEGVVEVEAEGVTKKLTAGDVARADRSSRPALEVLPQRAIAPQTSSRIAYRQKHVPSLDLGGFAGDSRAYLFLERRALVLPYAVPVTISSSGSHSAFIGENLTLPRGMPVDCYLLHSAPNLDRHVVKGSITFPGEVVGILASSDRLNATNDLFGTPWSLQCHHPERGLEDTPNKNSDSIRISPDRRTIAVNFQTESIDQIRILVRSE